MNNEWARQTQRVKAWRSMTPSARVISGHTGIIVRVNTIDPTHATSFVRRNLVSMSANVGRLSSTVKRFRPNSLQPPQVIHTDERITVRAWASASKLKVSRQSSSAILQATSRSDNQIEQHTLLSCFSVHRMSHILYTIKIIAFKNL